MARRWLLTALAGLIPLIYVSAFLAMAWDRSRQGHSEAVYTSEIDALAIHKEPAVPLADARTQGREVYVHYCRICHGEKGKGDGFNSSKLEPPPRNFTDAKFWQLATDERLHDAVAQGGPYVGKSLGMPAWGHTLSEREIHDAIVFIRTFASQPESQSE